MSTLPKLIYRFNTVTTQIPATYFVDINKLILKFVWKGKRLRIANTILKKKREVRRLTLPNFRTYYKAIILKTECYWWKYRQIDQWNTLESPEIDLHKYSQWLFWQKAIQWWKHSFQQMVFTSTWKKLNLDTDLTPLTKINSKWIIDLNVKCKTVHLIIEDNTEKF